ncbi:MAG: rubrerythrin family protein [Methanomassiliicoccus sp.]|nr:MAG: rubrerythrin family protein [Methanomassiliicoccus sp.]
MTERGDNLSKTEENLKAALAGESEARAKYVKWAGAANKEGHQAIAKIFMETAENEYEHASMLIKLLRMVGTTEENLKKAVEGETHEWTSMYPEFAKSAREEGNEVAAEFFEHVISIERHHAKRYQLILDRLKDGSLYKSDKDEIWFCTNCGYLHKGKESLDNCPNCQHPKGYFKRVCEIDYGKVEL